MSCRYRNSDKNFKLKLNIFAQSHALGKATNFQLDILNINAICCSVYFRKIVLES